MLHANVGTYQDHLQLTDEPGDRDLINETYLKTVWREVAITMTISS